MVNSSRQRNGLNKNVTEIKIYSKNFYFQKFISFSVLYSQNERKDEYTNKKIRIALYFFRKFLVGLIFH